MHGLGSHYPPESLSLAFGSSDFPEYLFSGCHDRAHAVYLLLPQAFRTKAVKLWVLAPSKITGAIRGDITLRDVLGNGRVRWGYHVALGFRYGNDYLVYDPALATGLLLDRSASGNDKLTSASRGGAWLQRMDVPSLVAGPPAGGSFIYSTEPRREGR